MKRVFELAQVCSWEEVWEAMLSLYPTQAKSKPGYFKVFNKMPSMKPSLSDQQLIVRESLMEPTDEKRMEEGIDSALRMYNNVFIIQESELTTELESELEPVLYSLWYVPWTEIIGLKVPDLSCSQFGAPGIIAHCLYEMTFEGFCEKVADRARWEAVKQRKAISKHRHIFKRNHFSKQFKYRKQIG